MPTACLAPEVRLMSVVYAPTVDHADARSLCYHPRPCRCLWSVLPPEARFVSVVYVAAGGCVNARNQVKSMIRAATDCEVQGSSSAVVAMSADSQFMFRDMEGFCDNTPKLPKEK